MSDERKKASTEEIAQAGGRARAEALSASDRKQIARKASQARWNAVEATHIGEWKIRDLELPCAVLADGTRVISQGGIKAAFGPVTGGWQMRKIATDEHSGDLPPFLVAGTLKYFISEDLRTLVSSPRRYRDPRGGPIRIGFEAKILPMVCEVWLKARDAGALTKIQLPVAERANILMRGLAHTGIIALVDEVTGYQYDRARLALSEILEKFISKELAVWAKRFPDDYYKQLFRLRQWSYDPGSSRRPAFAGKLTKDLVYKRLAPYVIEELERLNPKAEGGQRKARHHQWLTEDVGHPKLKEHLVKLIVLMEAADSWDEFVTKVNRVLPKHDLPLLALMERRRREKLAQSAGPASGVGPSR